jgi:hypothetical protein
MGTFHYSGLTIIHERIIRTSSFEEERAMAVRSSREHRYDRYFELPRLAAASILILIALTDPIHAKGRFELLSRTLMQAPPRTAAIMDDRVVLGTGGGIAVYRCSDGLTRESFLPTGGEPLDILLWGEIAYIAAYRGGLSVVDLSDPRHPVERNRIPSLDARFCARAGERLLIGDVRKGILVFDISSPFEPKLVATIKPKNQLVGLAAESNMIAVLSPRLVRIYMLDEKVGPWIATDLTTEVLLKRCLLHDGILYLLTVEGDVLRTGLSNPIVPKELDPLPVSGVIDMHIDSGTLVVLTAEGDAIPFDIAAEATSDVDSGTASGVDSGMATKADSGTESNGREEEIGAGVGEGEPPTAAAPAGGRPLRIKGGPKRVTGSWFERLTANIFGKSAVIGDRIFCTGKYLAAISYTDGLSVYRRSGETAVFAGKENPRGFAIDLIVRDDILYLGNNFGGLWIGRVGQDGSIDWISHVQTGEARDAALSGDVLILADGKFGLKLFDVSDPADPKLIGTHSSYFFESAIVVHNDIAYVAGGIGGVEVVDISNPRRPRLVWRQELSEVRGVHVDDDYLYLPDGDDGFRIYSLKGRVPEEISLLDTPGWNCDCFVIGDTVYLADGGHGIKVADISDRSNPRLQGSIDLGTIAREIHAIPGTVFVAAHTRGIMAIDVKDPEHPNIAAHYQTVDDARGVYTDGRFVYLAGGSGGLYIFRYIEE